MSYLERQASKRKDPRSVFPEAESMLVLGMNYFNPIEYRSSPLKGRISRYALGDDYHSVVREQLEALLFFIQKQSTGIDGRCFVDTGPLMEKSWGSKAGIGWMGKHTNLISKRLGSWFFLGVILLNIPLESDSPALNHCGTCRLCLDACPTGAIVAPYILDARHCLSYLTIEFRGLIPRHVRPLLGNRVFGCDSCQKACPWNRFSLQTSEKGFLPRAEIIDPDLVALSRITPAEFESSFESSPIYRATRDGLVRNAVMALGNSGRIGVIPALLAALEDESALVRASAAWALSSISLESAREILPKIQKREHDPLVLQEIEGLI